MTKNKFKQNVAKTTNSSIKRKTFTIKLYNCQKKTTIIVIFNGNDAYFEVTKNGWSPMKPGSQQLLVVHVNGDLGVFDLLPAVTV